MSLSVKLLSVSLSYADVAGCSQSSNCSSAYSRAHNGDDGFRADVDATVSNNDVCICTSAVMTQNQ